MKDLSIEYSRIDLLDDTIYSNDYKELARNLIDDVALELRKIENRKIQSLFVEMKTEKWLNEDIEAVYNININNHFAIQFMINELLKYNNAKRIAYRFNIIIENKYKEIDDIIENKYKGVSNE